MSSPLLAENGVLTLLEPPDTRGTYPLLSHCSLGRLGSTQVTSGQESSQGDNVETRDHVETSDFEPVNETTGVGHGGGGTS